MIRYLPVLQARLDGKGISKKEEECYIDVECGKIKEGSIWFIVYHLEKRTSTKKTNVRSDQTRSLSQEMKISIIVFF